MVAGRALRPISRITATARSISDRTLDARIALDGPRDELRELADTFDSMLERLEAAFESQRRFVANASHELRTPLAIVRTELDVTLDDPDADRDELRAMAYVVRDANERMERLIAVLLALASSEAGIVQARSADLAEIVAPALEREGAFAAGGALQLDATLDAARRCSATRSCSSAWRRTCRERRPLQRRRRLGARPHRHRARRGGPARRQPGRAHRPASAVEELLEPFRRLESSRARSTGGYGLGLAVVRAVAQAHGGRVARARARARAASR